MDHWAFRLFEDLLVAWATQPKAQRSLPCQDLRVARLDRFRALLSDLPWEQPLVEQDQRRLSPCHLLLEPWALPREIEHDRH